MSYSKSLQALHIAEHSEKVKDQSRVHQGVCRQQRRRTETDDKTTVSFSFLWNVFFASYLQKEHNHVGIYHSLDNKPKGKWLGLRDPPVFYMFDEITIEKYQKLVPTMTTLERWNRFLALRKMADPATEDCTFYQLFETLWDNEYMKMADVFVDGEYIDSSVENAVEEILRNDGAYSEAQIQKLMTAKREQIVSIFVQALLQKHALEHVEQAWVLTPHFFKTAERLGLVTFDNKDENTV